MNANADIIYLIAEHLDPDLDLYCRLAGVSRTFYYVFTSDRLWKRLNPYGRESGIFNHYQRTTTTFDRQLIQIYWSTESYEPAHRELASKCTKNKYVLVGLARRATKDEWLQKYCNSKRFMFAAASESSFFLASPKLRGDGDYFIACGLPFLQDERQAQDHFRRVSKEVILKIIESNPNRPGLGSYFCKMPAHFATDPDILDAMKDRVSTALIHLPIETIEQLGEASPELLLKGLDDYEQEFLELVPRLITKDVLLKLGDHALTCLFDHCDPEWLRDIDFVKHIFARAHETLSIPLTLRCTLKEANEISSASPHPQYICNRAIESPRYDCMSELRPSRSTLKEYINQECDYLLALEYWRVNSWCKCTGSNSRGPCKTRDKKRLLKYFTETEYIRKVMEHRLDIHPSFVSAEVLSNRELALELVMHHPLFYSFLSEEFKSDHEFFEALVSPDRVRLRFHRKPRHGTYREPQLDLRSLPSRWATDKASLKRIFLSKILIGTSFKEETIKVVGSDEDLLSSLLYSFGSEHPQLPRKWQIALLNADVLKTFAPYFTPSIEHQVAKMVRSYDFSPTGRFAGIVNELSRSFLLTIALESGVESKSLLEDSEILSNSLKNNPRLIELAPESIRNNPEQLIRMASINPTVISHLPLDMQSKVLDALRQQTTGPYESKKKRIRV